ncbi:hypothetical protein FBR02_10595 [Anaerolineae bacterium CFX9]|jgi:hypothetical protein|nr:hypothetical protein [Anaerolineae bacterium CFX9]
MAFVFFVEQIATGLFILLGAVGFLALRAFLRAGAELRSTQYELERELARFRRGNALTTLIVVIELAIVVIGVQRVVAPFLRETMDFTVTVAEVATDGTFAPVAPTPVPGGMLIDPSGVVLGEVDPASQILPTPTLTPTPVGTIVPNAPAAQGCDTPNATMRIPANGMIVFEPIVVIGTASIDDFAYYKFELNGPSTFGNFAPLAQYTQPVPEEGALGQFVPAPYDPGTYRFRLIVFDITNTARADCTLTIYISAPIPTPTPLGTAAP